MRGHVSLLGAYIPRLSLLHSAPLWAKVLSVSVLSILVLGFNSLAVTGGGLILVALAYLAGARLSFRELVQPLLRMWPLILVLGIFQVFTAGPLKAFLVVGNIVVCVLAALLIPLTTESQRLLDGLVSLAKPLRPLGADPERFGLTVALMLRSIPYLVGSAADARDAARARGLERNPRALILPLFIGAVAYAQQTGEALAARGLAEPDDDGVAGGNAS
ncbi:energy-coupling factor transporter transmembrane protein EcfT [Arthrobacter sp. JZ12]|uniref:CbiQ family ECF transporter T component n=1 Tax=Arthrobacter sp. JZ12 TaxID=2654190 RepID=UPI002B48C0EA|nr:CbiQ family ECF transporter T component [Arthrobacter sp. JZ12]WRH24916.1 energy-coupling factor transporter transmembrane protein EcfT [Arthrobacter sp. JZ12]